MKLPEAAKAYLNLSLRPTENPRTVCNNGGIASPVICSVLPYSLNEMRDKRDEIISALNAGKLVNDYRVVWNGLEKAYELRWYGARVSYFDKQADCVSDGLCRIAGEAGMKGTELNWFYQMGE